MEQRQDGSATPAGTASSAPTGRVAREAWRLGPLCPLSRVEGKGRALGTPGHHPAFLWLTGKADEILGRARSPHGHISGAEATLLGFRSRPCPSAATSRKPGALSTSARVRLYTGTNNLRPACRGCREDPTSQGESRAAFLGTRWGCLVLAVV